MNQSRTTRSAALPAWINQLTRFNAGSQGSEMLFSIHRETIQYQANSEAKTAILVALAQGLGNFNYSSRPLAARELQDAAQAMPPALGRPILRMLALQDAFKPWT